MTRSDDSDREAVDRTFAEMVRTYHLTAERPDPLPASPARSEDPDDSWADTHPLFHFAPPSSAPVAEPEPDPPYVPEPLPPMPRPGWAVLLGWVGIGVAVLLVLAATFGLRFPTWAAWLAVGSFLTGFGILLTQLPRHRPPDAGDGAVL